MGKMGNVAFINSFVGEVRNTQKEFAAIRQKRAEKAQKDELFNLQKKKYELEIKEKERTGAVTPLDAKSMISEFKDYTAMLSNESKTQDILLDQAQSANMNKQKKLGSIAQQITPTLRIMTNAKGEKSSSMSFTPKSASGNQPTAVDKTLGSLSSGGIVDSYGYKNTFQTRDHAETYAASHLGPDYKTNYPEAEQYINKLFPTNKQDNFGFSKGEKKSVPGKGNYEYIGGNKWKKVK